MGASSTRNWDQPRDKAVPRLVKTYGRRLLGLSRRMCRSHEDAEDVVQETFLQAWRKWDQFEGRADPASWLYRIASRICQRKNRRRAGEPQRLESLEELLPFHETSMPLVDDESALDAHIRKEMHAAVGRSVADLPLEFRLPLVLKDLVGLSVAEVAEVLGIKNATVKTRVHRARLKLRQAVTETLPSKPVGPPSYTRQVCLDLLQAKQEALDRGVPLPHAAEVMCERCRNVFDTLDLTQDIVRQLEADTELPPSLRDLLLQPPESWRPRPAPASRKGAARKGSARRARPDAPDDDLTRA